MAPRTAGATGWWRTRRRSLELVAAATPATAVAGIPGTAVAAAISAATADVAGAVACAIAAMAGGHAVELVNEAAGYAQRRIQRKQAGQALRLPGIDPFVPAGQPPGPLDAVAGLRRRRHRLGGRVVQKAPEGMAAEAVVLAGDKLHWCSVLACGVNNA